MGSDASGIETAPDDYAQIMFPGQMRTLSDVYYNRYRDYDPTIGRYIQADPIGLAAGSNPYLYAKGNPPRYTDPTGKCPLCIVGLGLTFFFEGYLIDVAVQYFWDGRSWHCIDQRQAIGSGVVGVVTGGGTMAVFKYGGRLVRPLASKISRLRWSRSAADRASAASVADKLDRYLLNPTHPVGKSKAEFFEKALGFSRENSGDLARQLVFDEAKAVQTTVTQYGTKFNQTIDVLGANQRVIPVTSA